MSTTDLAPTFRALRVETVGDQVVMHDVATDGNGHFFATKHELTSSEARMLAKELIAASLDMKQPLIGGPQWFPFPDKQPVNRDVVCAGLTLGWKTVSYLWWANNKWQDQEEQQYDDIKWFIPLPDEYQPVHMQGLTKVITSSDMVDG